MRTPSRELELTGKGIRAPSVLRFLDSGDIYHERGRLREPGSVLTFDPNSIFESQLGSRLKTPQPRCRQSPAAGQVPTPRSCWLDLSRRNGVKVEGRQRQKRSDGGGEGGPRALPNGPH